MGPWLDKKLNLFHIVKSCNIELINDLYLYLGVNGDLLKKRQSYKPRRMMAFSPKLMTSLRSRPADVPSQQQREEEELEEMKQ
jgi:hypothetical protein